MSKHPRGRQPYIPPVTRLELVRTDSKARWIAIAVLLAIGVTAITVGLFSLLNTEPGWVTVEAAPEGISCADEFILQYDFSDAGGAASAQNKQLTQVYTEATEDAFLLFSPDVGEADVGNLYAINQNLNQQIQVEEALFRALAQVEQTDNRMLYLAPVYVEYDRVFQSEADVTAEQYDPQVNPEVREYIQQIVSYTSDPEHIRLELQGDNQVKLVVSEAYLAFAQENGIDRFLDFGWMKNAFVADYIAEVLADAGYTNGYLASFDGFTRNLDNRGESYSFNLFDRARNVVYLPGVLHYDKPVSIVFLRSYPMDEMDQWHYYAYEDGRIVTAMIDPTDGVSKSAKHNLVSYSFDKGCSEILLEMLPVFVEDVFDENTVDAMRNRGIFSIWFEGSTLCYNEENAAIEIKAVPSGDAYTKAFAG